MSSEFKPISALHKLLIIFLIIAILKLQIYILLLFCNPKLIKVILSEVPSMKRLRKYFLAKLLSQTLFLN